MSNIDKVIEALRRSFLYQSNCELTEVQSKMLLDRIAELKAFIDQLIEAGDDIADDYCNDTLTPYGLQIVKNWQALIKDWKEH